MSQKIRYNFDFLQNFCEENKIEISEEFNEKNVNCNTKIKGSLLRRKL